MTFLDADVSRSSRRSFPRGSAAAPDTTSWSWTDEGCASWSDPVVGPLDPTVVREAFLDAVGAASAAAWLMSRVWRDAGISTVERRSLMTSAGKVLHLHRETAAAPAAAGASA